MYGLHKRLANVCFELPDHYCQVQRDWRYKLKGDSGDLCNCTTQHSSRKAIRSVIEKKNPLEKPQIIQDQFENKTSILDRETDSNFPRNFK